MPVSEICTRGRFSRTFYCVMSGNHYLACGKAKFPNTPLGPFGVVGVDFVLFVLNSPSRRILAFGLDKFTPLECQPFHRGRMPYLSNPCIAFTKLVEKPAQAMITEYWRNRRSVSAHWKAAS